MALHVCREIDSKLRKELQKSAASNDLVVRALIALGSKRDKCKGTVSGENRGELGGADP